MFKCEAVVKLRLIIKKTPCVGKKEAHGISKVGSPNSPRREELSKFTGSKPQRVSTVVRKKTDRLKRK